MSVPRRRIARNTIYNLAGQVLPLLAAVIAYPVLKHALGDFRFGVLTIAWVAIGYFSLFDLGLSRAITHALARTAHDDADEHAAISWTALWMMGLLGVVGSVVLATLAAPLSRALDAPPDLFDECVHAVQLVALSLPWLVITGGFRGIFEAHQDFGVATILRIPFGLISFLGPLALVPFTTRLEPMILVIVAGRVVICLAHAIVAFRRYPFLRRRVRWRSNTVAPLIRYGGWSTVSNIVSPLMVTVDRLTVGIRADAAASGEYAPPFEIVSRLWIIPQALLGVMFPVMSASLLHDRERAPVLIDGGLRAMIVTVFPLTLVLAAFAPEGLSLWLGSEVTLASAPVMRWLTVGVFVNCVAQVAFFAVQAADRPDLTAKAHLVELPLYAALFWALTGPYGIVGAAAASSLRMIADAAVLGIFAARLVPSSAGVLRSAIAPVSICTIALVAVMIPSALAARAVLTAIVLVVFAIYAWLRLVRPAERERLKAVLSSGGI